MKPILTVVAISCALVATALLAASPLMAPANAAINTRVPILLELFTSEGCSSCPPADSLLASLDRQPVANAELIVLSEHVDYWNYLGWRDPYSSPVFSDRQHEYSQRLGSTVYTPQLVIDGRVEALGSDRPEVLRAIAQAARQAKIPISIHAEHSGSSANLHLEANTNGINADLYIAIAADTVQSQVLRGENGGHTLTHVAVAQSIIEIGKWGGPGVTTKDVKIPVKLLPEQIHTTRIVAILQDPSTGRVLGTTQTRFHGEKSDGG